MWLIQLSRLSIMLTAPSKSTTWNQMDVIWLSPKTTNGNTCGMPSLWALSFLLSFLFSSWLSWGCGRPNGHYCPAVTPSMVFFCSGCGLSRFSATVSINNFIFLSFFGTGCTCLIDSWEESSSSSCHCRKAFTSWSPLTCSGRLTNGNWSC